MLRSPWLAFRLLSSLPNHEPTENAVIPTRMNTPANALLFMLLPAF
jgi:hypothetical protein